MVLQFLAEEDEEEEELEKVQAIYNSILFSIHSFVFITITITSIRFILLAAEEEERVFLYVLI